MRIPERVDSWYCGAIMRYGRSSVRMKGGLHKTAESRLCVTLGGGGVSVNQSSTSAALSPLKFGPLIEHIDMESVIELDVKGSSDDRFGTGLDGYGKLLMGGANSGR